MEWVNRVFYRKYGKLLLSICLTCFRPLKKIAVEIDEGKLYLKYKCDCINTHRVIFNDYYYGINLLNNFNYLSAYPSQKTSGYCIRCNGKAFIGMKNRMKYHETNFYNYSLCLGHKKANPAFCMQCQKQICVNCVITSHSSHQVKSLYEMYQDIDDDYRNIFENPNDFIDNLLIENNFSTTTQLKEDFINLYKIVWETFKILCPLSSVTLFEPISYLVNLKKIPIKKKSSIIYKNNFIAKLTFIVVYVDAFFKVHSDIHYENLKQWLCLDNKKHAILFQGKDSSFKKKIVLIDFYDFYLDNFKRRVNPGFYVETMIKLDNNKVFLGGDALQIWNFDNYRRVKKILLNIKYTTGGIYIKNKIIIYGEGFIKILDKEGKTKIDLNSFSINKTIKLDNNNIASIDIKIIKMFYKDKNSLIVIYTTYFEVYDIKKKKKVFKKLLSIDNCKNLLIYDSVLSKDGLIICFIYQYGSTNNNYLVAWETKNYTLRYKIPKKNKIGKIILLKNIIQINLDYVKPSYHDTQTGEETCEGDYNLGDFENNKNIISSSQIFHNYYVVLHKGHFVSINYLN